MAAPGDNAVTAALLTALKDNYYVQNSAAQALSQAASGDNAVVAALLTALKSDDPMLRSGAARALGPAAPGHNAVVAALFAALNDDEPEVRYAVAQALGPAASRDNAVVAALLAALNDDEPLVRLAVAQALGPAASGDNAVVAAQIAALKHDHPLVRRTAAQAFGPAASGDKAVFVALLAALKRKTHTSDTRRQKRCRSWRLLTKSCSGRRSRTFSNILSNPARVFGVIPRLTEGRQLPGYRWRSLQGRRQSKERSLKIAKATGTGLTIGALLYFGGDWYAGLPETSSTKAFLKAVPAISALLGLLWGLVLVFRGEKRTLW